ncbi:MULTISPECIES: xylulokinase [unclassified Cryobacterium]|uniref:xylulokinase n=1 Tax=unclassified Cryobacterium TaxID=2649013 RepID=UPI00106CBDE4|nr:MULTISPECIES: xylulokinase [unclassified Cryobacterium]TFC58668.1 xylulokinase [Cryobacterium sp. TMB3-1-2]TFC67089.1 xylulokinase [Cryobacterium sp. TMB3-15]TFC73398.1 xylulokinase [Cryobacterium sp. TMB3-10]TFD44129.1 xylulokinase [Cryobacterium sp. TMB3-12]
MALVAGVDSSTQSCKIVVRDAETGALVRTGKASHPVGTEVDPAAWWDALLAAVEKAGGLDDVAAVSVAAQQHGMVVLDEDGRVIRPALLWNDTRSAQAAADLIDEVGAAEYARRTGLVPVASFTVTKLRWLRDAEPANAARVAAVALPHDWLSWRLRGYGPAGESELGPVLTALTTDRSDASGTGYFSAALDDYDRELLVRGLGHDAVLPRVLGPGETAGTTVALPGVPAGLVVGVGAGDNAGAALGLGATAGDVIVSIGTSGTVFAVTAVPSEDASGAVAGFADASGLHLPLIATLNAARILDSIAGLLGVDHHELGRLALEAEPGAQGLVLQPYFEGERTPNLPDATASLFGMTLTSTTRPNLARAAIEGLLCGLADGLDAVRAQGVSVERILLIGGAAQNPAVQFIAAQVFDAPVAVPTPGEYVADGGAAQAAWSLTGTRPAWSVAVEAHPTPDFRPVIRAQYAAHRA